MLPELERQLTDLEHRRQHFLGIIAQSTEAQRYHKPTPEAWCMVEVAQHLLLAEAQTLVFIQKYPPITPSLAQKIRAKLSYWGLVTFLKLPLKFRVPPRANISPLTPRRYDEVLSEWNQVRQQLYAYADSYTEDKRDLFVFKHPLAGKLTFEQTLTFFKEHINHHVLQLERLKITAPNV